MNLSDLTRILTGMAHSRLHNYIVPGLTSSLVGGGGRGTIRLFENSRNHQENVTPHSHRFDFQCLVLDGEIQNQTWTQVGDNDPRADEFMASTLTYAGEPGAYLRTDGKVLRYISRTRSYGEGEWYGMRHDEIHSIRFSRGAKVLFIEGVTQTDETTVLEPFINGARVPTFEVSPWMFLMDSE